MAHTFRSHTGAFPGLWLAIQNYNQAVQQFMVQAEEDRQLEARQQTGSKFAVEIDSPV